MPFGAGTVVTNVGRAIAAARHLGATPAQPEPHYLAIGTGATGAARTAAVTDTALSGETETRVQGLGAVFTTSVAGDTYQVTGAITATASRAVDEAATFDQASGGGMDVSATFPVINLAAGDSLQLTFRKQFA